MYYEFFNCQYRYSQLQLKNLYRRTGGFTYYDEDLKYGIINLDGKINYYDTIEARENADANIDSLNKFLKKKVI